MIFSFRGFVLNDKTAQVKGGELTSSVIHFWRVCVLDPHGRNLFFLSVTIVT